MLTTTARNFYHFKKQILIDWLNLQVSPDVVYPKISVSDVNTETKKVSFEEQFAESQVDKKRTYTLDFSDIVDNVLGTDEFTEDDIVDIVSYDNSKFTVEY